MRLRPLRCSALALVLFVVSPEAGATEKSACLDAHANAQILRRAGHLRQARAQLTTCASAGCPPLVTKDCTQWLVETDREQPTVVFVAHDEAGHDVADARIVVDGEPLVDRLDGRPVEIDPGDHAVRCELSGGRTLETRIVVRDGEKNRAVVFDPAPHPPPPPPPPRTEPEVARSWLTPGTIALGTVSAIAIGSFAVLGLTGNARESSLASNCRPNCAQDDIDGVHRLYVVADVALIVGVVAAAGAVWLALNSQSPRPAR